MTENKDVPAKDEPIPADRRRNILRVEIEKWENTKYKYEVDIEVADAIGDDRMHKTAVAEIRNCIIALKKLREKLQGI